jgi:2-methylcitrate dehydratase PrpD
MSRLPDYVENLLGCPAGDLATSTLQRSAAVIADTVAVATLAAGRAELRALAPCAPAGVSSTVLAEVPTTAADSAALVNATAAVWNELDEGLRGAGHPAAHVVPAAVAVAEAEGRTLVDLLAAVVCGYQVQADLGRAFVLHEEVHPHGALGAPAAALAASRLLELDVSQAMHAVGIAADLAPAGSWTSCVSGRTVRNVLAGHGAQVGVRAAYLARAGLTSAPDALDVAFGLVRGTRSTSTEDAAPVRQDGWAIHHGYLKRWSACAWSHAALDAAASLIPSLDTGSGIEAGSVKRVEVRVPKVAMRLKDLNRESGLAVRFSLPMLIATLLTHGDLNGHVDDAWHDDAVLDLATRVSVREDPAMTRCWPQEMPSAVTVFTAGGSRLDADVRNPDGPVDDEGYVSAVRLKLRGLGADDSVLDRLLAQVDRPSGTRVEPLFCHPHSKNSEPTQIGSI